MNIIIGVTAIIFSLYLFIVNRPSGFDSKCLFAINITAGIVSLAGVANFSSALHSILTVAEIFCIAFLEYAFYFEIMREKRAAAKRTARRAADRTAKKKSVPATENKGYVAPVIKNAA